MTLKRDARGTLRDYKRESEGEFLSVFPSFFNSSKVFSMAFSATSILEPNCDSPRRCFTSFDKTYSSHRAFAVPTAKCFRIMAVFFWSDKTKVFSSIIEPISIDMVNKSPTVFWFPYDMIMDKIASKSSIAVVAFIKLYPDKLFLINIFIKNGIAHKIMSHIIQWGFNDVPIEYSVIDNSIFIDGWQGCFTPVFLPIIVKPTKTFGKVWSVASFDSTFHNYIILKNNKVSRRING